MSHRLTIAGSILLVLAGLLVWQDYRWRLVRDCEKRGGLWDGAYSKCRLVPARILIEKNLKRS